MIVDERDSSLSGPFPLDQGALLAWIGAPGDEDHRDMARWLVRRLQEIATEYGRIRTRLHSLVPPVEPVHKELMEPSNERDPHSRIIDVRTQEQIDDYERYRSAELARHFSLVSAAALQSSSCNIDDNPAIVRGTD
jgi:hypothetical protein